MPKKSLRRRRTLETGGIRRFGTKEEGFSYARPDGRPVTAPAVLDRIRRLAIPPAWTEVRIALTDGAPLQAIGTDKKGRLQYRYHPRFRQQRDDEKFLRIVHFGESLPALRRRVQRDLTRGDLGRDHVVAAIVRLIDQAFFRIGNDRSAKSEETYGLTTVLTDHVSVRGDTLQFDFVGKWKKSHKRQVSDKQVATIVRRLRRIEGDELFKYVDGSRVRDVKDRHVNDYIQDAIGDDFTAKDFRTWAGTLLCSMVLAAEGQAETKRERKRRVTRAIETTAGLLGNTPAVCRASYICPRLLEEYMDGRTFESLRLAKKASPVARSGLSIEERALLKFFRETIADRRRIPRAA